MKIRTSFVTNSSSSSFIIAIKNIDKDGIVEELNKKRKEIAETVNWYGDGTNVDEVIQECAENIISSVQDGFKLGDWRVGTATHYSDGSPASGVLYEHGHFDTENFKMKAEY